ncbi:MAG TPA: hypothetical protein VGK22_17870 [Candidatus Angelobacter sp.]|jgi:hypothetical protein
MKTAFTALIVFLLCAGYSANAQAQPQPAAPQRMQTASPAPANINTILTAVQQATNSASVDIGKLRVERWKTDPDQKQQLQHIGDSLQKSIANAVPALVADVQSSRGGVSASFKLYHNLNVIYENLNYLADVAGGLGKKEEFEPLSADCAALETARQSLSIYITESAGRLEAANRQPPVNAVPVQTQVPGKKVVIINDDQPVKKAARPTKKKTSPPAASTSPSAPAQSAAAPH